MLPRSCSGHFLPIYRPDNSPRVSKNRRYRQRESWWWIDRRNNSIPLGPKTRIESTKHSEPGTVEHAVGQWRVVRWDNKRNGDVGAREYVKVTRIRPLAKERKE